MKKHKLDLEKAFDLILKDKEKGNVFNELFEEYLQNVDSFDNNKYYHPFIYMEEHVFGMMFDIRSKLNEMMGDKLISNIIAQSHYIMDMITQRKWKRARMSWISLKKLLKNHRVID